MSLQEYVQVPIRVEAWKLTSEEELPAIAKWCNGRVKGLSITFPKIRDKTKTLDSQERHSYASPGDYIVRVSNGFKVVRGETFENSYRALGKRS